jgi:phosphoribosylformimino-5-aminoimidazole carboxamide ribotide isomerase
MQIIPVLDLANGVAVHARAGERARYAPVASALAPGTPGEALALARAFRQLGARSCYVADLDAILGGAPQLGLIHQLARSPEGFDGMVWVDAGTTCPERAAELLRAGAARVVVGLETLRSFADLAAIVQAIGSPRVVFSLDLRLGTPLAHPSLLDAGRGGTDAVVLAEQGVAAGASAVIVLDLARVGTGVGIDHGLLAALRRRLPEAELLAGGGVLERRDLERLEDVGCDGVLLASALHAGRITAQDLSALRRRQSPARARR